MGLAVLHQDGVGLLAHELDELIAVGDVDGLGGDVGLGVAAAIPIEVVAARAPAAAIELRDGDQLHLGVVRALDLVVGAADRQLPADIGLGLDEGDALAQREAVKGAALAALEAGPVEEDAATVDYARLALAIPGLDGRALAVADVVELPVLPIELGCPLEGALLIGLVCEVRPLGAAAAVGGGRVDPLAAATEDAGPLGGQPGEVDAIATALLAGVVELDPGAGEVKGDLRHPLTLACVGGSTTACRQMSE